MQDGVVLLPPDANAMMQHQRQNAARPSSIDIEAKGLPSPSYSESPYGNGTMDHQQRADFRLVFFLVIKSFFVLYSRTIRYEVLKAFS